MKLGDVFERKLFAVVPTLLASHKFGDCEISHEISEA